MLQRGTVEFSTAVPAAQTGSQPLGIDIHRPRSRRRYNHAVLYINAAHRRAEVTSEWVRTVHILRVLGQDLSHLLERAPREISRVEESGCFWGPRPGAAEWPCCASRSQVGATRRAARRRRGGQRRVIRVDAYEPHGRLIMALFASESTCPGSCPGLLGFLADFSFFHLPQ